MSWFSPKSNLARKPIRLRQVGVRSIQRRQIFLPLVVVVENVVGNIEAIVAGSTRLVQQSHPGFIRCTSAFVPVAGNAGADHIVPGVLPASAARNNVVQGEFLGLSPAILACVLVAVKYLGPA